MKDLSLADIITIRNYLQNHQPYFVNSEGWNRLIESLEEEIDKRTYNLYLTL